MSPDSVAAVLRDPLSVALGPVDAVFTGGNALDEAIESSCEWLWLLAPGAHPDTGALEHLLHAAGPTTDPVASVVAGLVLDGSGKPVEERLPAPQYADSAAILRLVEQRLLPIRHAPFANCLIQRTAFARFGMPDIVRFGPYADRVWTSAVISDGPGYFAPLSVVRITDPAPDTSPADAFEATNYALRAARSGAWTKGESLRTVKRVLDSARR